jgi:hypothetical protein
MSFGNSAGMGAPTSERFKFPEDLVWSNWQKDKNRSPPKAAPARHSGQVRISPTLAALPHIAYFRRCQPVLTNTDYEPYCVCARHPSGIS